MKPVPPIDDDTAAELVRSALPQAAAGACPDENLLAGWAEGRLDASRTATVLEHLTRCDECRRIALAWNAEWASGATDASAPERTKLPMLVPDPDAATSGPSAGGSAPGTQSPSLGWLAQHASTARDRGVFVKTTPTRRPQGALLRFASALVRRRSLRFAAAAAILALIGVVVVRATSRSETSTTDERLVAAAHALASSHADQFKDFEPVGPAERRALRDDGLRGAVTITEPSGALLDAPTTIRWTEGPAASSYAVMLADANGRELWRTTTRSTNAEFPTVEGAASGGRFVLSVTATSALGATTSNRAFSIATAAERADWSKAATTLAASTKGDLQPLLLAHLAIRRGYFAEAVRALSKTAEPRDAAIEETLAYATRRMHGASGK